MFVLNIKGHYELLYSEKDNNKYKSIFKQYICNYIPNILVEENMVINEKTKTLETPNDIYFNEKEFYYSHPYLSNYLNLIILPSLIF